MPATKKSARRASSGPRRSKIAIGINWEGRRSVLAVELVNRASKSSWRDFLSRMRDRGLGAVQFVVTDDHAGLKQAITEYLPEAIWQRCYVHFLRNARDYLPRRADDGCLQELRWRYDRRDLSEARRDLLAWLEKWQGRYPRLCDWVESGIEETFSFYRLPRQHYKHLKSTNMLERLNEEIKRRPHVVRIFLGSRQLPALDQGACSRATRELDRGQPLPEHVVPERATQRTGVDRRRLNISEQSS